MFAVIPGTVIKAYEKEQKGADGQPTGKKIPTLVLFQDSNNMTWEISGFGVPVKIGQKVEVPAELSIWVSNDGRNKKMIIRYAPMLQPAKEGAA